MIALASIAVALCNTSWTHGKLDGRHFVVLLHVPSYICFVLLRSLGVIIRRSWFFWLAMSISWCTKSEARLSCPCFLPTSSKNLNSDCCFDSNDCCAPPHPTFSHRQLRWDILWFCRTSVVQDLLMLSERQPKIAWGTLLIIPEQLMLDCTGVCIMLRQPFYHVFCYTTGVICWQICCVSMFSLVYMFHN